MVLKLSVRLDQVIQLVRVLLGRMRGSSGFCLFQLCMQLLHLPRAQELVMSQILVKTSQESARAMDVSWDTNQGY